MKSGACMVAGILQARILEWVAMPSSRGSSQTWIRTLISCIFYTSRWIVSHWCYLRSFCRIIYLLSVSITWNFLHFFPSKSLLLDHEKPTSKMVFFIRNWPFSKITNMTKVKCLPKWLIQLLLWQSLWFTLAASLSQRLGFSLSLWSACPSSHPWLRVTQETYMNNPLPIVFVYCGQREFPGLPMLLVCVIRRCTT